MFVMLIRTAHVDDTLRAPYTGRKRGEKARQSEREKRYTLDRSLFNIKYAVLIFRRLLCNLHSCGIKSRERKEKGGEKRTRERDR